MIEVGPGVLLVLGLVALCALFFAFIAGVFVGGRIAMRNLLPPPLQQPEPPAPAKQKGMVIDLYPTSRPSKPSA